MQDTHEGSGEEGRRAVGAERFVVSEGETEGGKTVIEQANKVLGFA